MMLQDTMFLAMPVEHACMNIVPRLTIVEIETTMISTEVQTLSMPGSRLVRSLLTMT